MVIKLASLDDMVVYLNETFKDLTAVSNEKVSITDNPVPFLFESYKRTLDSKLTTKTNQTFMAYLLPERMKLLKL